MSMQTASPLDAYIPPSSRAWIEDRYYARINAQSSFEAMLADGGFWTQLGSHVGFFSDHGVVHVRDVALQVLQVLKTVPGLLIATRPEERLQWMRGYGVALAYLHDIGMSDFSSFGRAVHAEFAGQEVFRPELDDWVAPVWPEIGGGFAARLEGLQRIGVFVSPLETIARELLSLAVAHSKSRVPISLLNDQPALRTYMLATLSTPLVSIYQALKPGSSLASILGTPAPSLSPHYGDFENEGFSWLVADHPEAQDFVHDVIDTLRVLRCADALRQRGTVQKTSGGYEVFVNRQTGNPVYALRRGDDHLYLLEREYVIPGGEANTASSELNRDGNLRISFHLGGFDNEPALDKAAYSAAFIVNDIQGDVIESFEWPAAFPEGSVPPLKNACDIEILLENTPEGPDIVTRVIGKLHEINPKLTNPIHVVPSLHNATPQEIARYLEAPELDWGIERRRALLDRVAQTGHQTQTIDPEEGLRHVREVVIKAGETLIEAAAPSGFVYLPMGTGLLVVPLGGYAAFSVKAWMPLGITGVIRGAVRNADVRAEHDVPALIIPQEVFMAHWHHTLSLQDLAQLLGQETE